MASPATEKLLQENSEDLGVPGRVRRFTWMDLGAVAVVLLAFVVALNAVLYKPTALLLGQTNQLILLGLMLSVMGSCTQRQIQKLLLVYEARAGKSTLQNFDAILRTDYFSKAVSLRPRIVLLFLFALPLGLGVSYKKFSGGSTSIGVSNTGADFGFTAAPGYQLIGNGLSLLVDAYLPFWIKPSLGRTYGFNLYVAADNKTAAILDAPLPKDLSKLQASLNDHESINITATVNATVTENIDPSTAERYDYNGYWHEKALMFNQNGPGRVGAANGAYQDMWASTNCSPCNYTEVFLSLWNVTRNQSFYSEVERFVSTRRTCQGVWKLTRLNVSLVDVAYLQSADEIDATQNQDVIANVINSVKPMFFPFLGEYDWKTREAWDQPLPGNSDPGEPPQFFPALNTRPALVAAMLWARTTSNVGPERPYVPSFASGLTSYSKDASHITLVKQGLTLQRSPWLIVVLAIHPLLTIIVVLAKAALSTTPIGDGFGLISLLAGIREEGLEVLRGAALSGELSQKVRIRFTASKAEGLDYERLYLDLGSQAKSDRLDPKVRYG
ncbi:MAG: hypothetical protein ASARMPREDX12_005101 [Alectoria sarmentosa]|nr:MAG: hypothetical protein ASARMPREDX12_005101 [Alectoria sarmentosa]CAD6578696.1 MAG: hypothetical protein ASARMPRED_008806 [Alectoria sarmentosa]